MNTVLRVAAVLVWVAVMVALTAAVSGPWPIGLVR